jgi:SAM-dependent methyltransferase
MQLQPDRQDAVNRRIYQAAKVHKWYPPDAGLDRAETVALLSHAAAFAGRDVLDIGVGTGRTTPFLAPVARSYVATDYSAPLLAEFRRIHSGADARIADMRDLSAFGDASFDFVFASANVIDAVSHDDRLRTLGEFRRVLRPGGVVMFSSHNRGYRNAFRGPWIERARNPVTQAVYVARFMRGVMNHARVGPLRRRTDEYALLNDHGHDYAALHYYVDREHQRAQLEQAGFALLDVFDTRGRKLSGQDDDSDSPSLLYVARRNA